MYIHANKCRAFTSPDKWNKQITLPGIPSVCFIPQFATAKTHKNKQKCNTPWNPANSDLRDSDTFLPIHIYIYSTQYIYISTAIRYIHISTFDSMKGLKKKHNPAINCNIYLYINCHLLYIYIYTYIDIYNHCDSDTFLAMHIFLYMYQYTFTIYIYIYIYILYQYINK